MNRVCLCIFAAAVSFCTALCAKTERIVTWWDKTDWSKPEVYPFDKSTLPFQVPEHIKAVQIKGVDFKGKPSKFFCWYGVPEHKKGERVPGIVLVHGGGGFAFSRWVEMWNSRGYAAIALDTCGNIPQHQWERKVRKPVRNPEHGATEAEKYKVDIPQTDQWSYQAVAEIMLAHSFLRSLDGVDKDRIGVTGVSWGGYLTTLAAGVDDRFAFAIPVYGCGFFKGTRFYPSMKRRKRTDADFDKWCSYWDANKFLSNAKMPVLFVNGCNDHFFYLHSWTRTTEIPTNVYMALQAQMKHSHANADVPVVRAFADMVTKGKINLPRLVSAGVKDNTAFAQFDSPVPVISAQYIYSTEDGVSVKRKWTTVKLKTKGAGNIRLEHKVPENAAVGYFSVCIKNEYAAEPGFAVGYAKIPVFSSSRPIFYKKNK